MALPTCGLTTTVANKKNSTNTLVAGNCCLLQPTTTIKYTPLAAVTMWFMLLLSFPRPRLIKETGNL